MLNIPIFAVSSTARSLRKVNDKYQHQVIALGFQRIEVDAVWHSIGQVNEHRARLSKRELCKGGEHASDLLSLSVSISMSI